MKNASYTDKIHEMKNLFSEFLKKLNPEIISYLTKMPNKFYEEDLSNSEWSEIKFPPLSGVYAIFGKEQVNEKIGVYIGKASNDSTIGLRLYHHLNQPGKSLKSYYMKDKSGNDFKMEKIFAILLDDETWFFASSLEEFLIFNLKEKGIHLLNCIGNN